jgi:hypothetical protein
MRTFVILAGLTLGVVWTGSAYAQSSSGSSGSSGSPTILNILRFPKSLNINVQPNITNNSPMDYRNTNTPIGTTLIRPNTTGTAFSYRLASTFYQPSRPNFIASTTTFGSSMFPTPAQMQSAAPGYFAPFQMYRAAPLP